MTLGSLPKALITRANVLSLYPTERDIGKSNSLVTLPPAEITGDYEILWHASTN